jgi:hypothetical protein
MVKEMRLVDIKKDAVANKFVEEKYIPDHNIRFSVHPKNANNMHQPLSKDMMMMLPSIFSIQSKRKVNNDYTIQFKTKWYQLNDIQKTTVYKRDTVVIEERLDGSIHIRIKNVYLKYRVLPQRPKPVFVPAVALTRQKPFRKPPKDHPWRNFNF